jgi:hydrogenase maturation protease
VTTPSTPVAFIGLGNRFRADDAIGILATQKLHNSGISRYCYSEDNESLDVMIERISTLQEVRDVVIIDAAAFGGQPGDTMWIDNADDLARVISTHQADLPVYMQLLHNMGKRVRLLAIAPEDLGFTEGLSQILKHFLDTQLVDLVKSELRNVLNF